MSNVAGKAYGMNVLTPMRPCLTWINRFLFMASRAIPTSLAGLLGLSIIHFARWVIIKRDSWPDLGQGNQKLKNDYMLFCSNFNGTWDQYIDAFSDGIPGGLDLLWYLQHQISAFDPDHAVQELHPGQPDRHGLLLQRHAGRGAARHQGGAADPPRCSGSGRPTEVAYAAGFPQAVRRRAGRAAERSRLARATPRSRATTPKTPTRTAKTTCNNQSKAAAAFV